MTTSQATPSQSKNTNCFLWGCLIVFVLICLVFACLASVVGLAFAGIDLLGINFEEGIENILPWPDFLDDPSFIPDFDDFFDEGEPYYDEGEPDSDIDSYEPEPPSEFVPEIEAIPGFVPYSANYFYASFLYPEGWDIEEEEFRITFYDPDSYTYIYVGADGVDEGTTAAQVSSEVIERLELDAEEGSFVIFENGPYNLPAGYDTYLNAYEWTDEEGYYQWAYDLEIIVGDSNIFFFLVGEEPEEFDSYRSMFEIVADSFSR